MLEVINYIKNHPNWREDLSNPPYCLKIKQYGRYIHFKYDQINSRFNYKIVQECRGLILEDETFRVLACPFFKFFNYGETNEHEIDWNSATYEEKFDGSLIKVWYDDIENKWIVSSNGSIFASNVKEFCFVDRKGNKPYNNLEELFLDSINVDINNFVKGYTYVFELISPYNQVVVKYDKCEVIHLMTRDNTTLQEVDMDLGIRKPTKYTVKSSQDLINMTKQMSSQEEGIVVCDKYYNRVKIKSPKYVYVHHLITQLSELNLLRVIRAGEYEEVRAYLHGREEIIDSLYNSYQNYLTSLEVAKVKYLWVMKMCTSKSDFARAIKDEEDKHFGFEVYKNPTILVQDYVDTIRDKILLERLLKDRKEN